MIQKALEYLVGLRPNQTYSIDGRHYSDRSLVRIDAPIFHPDRVVVGSLDGIINLVKTEIGKANTPLFVHVEDPSAVRVFSTLIADDLSRDSLYRAECKDANFREGWRDQQTAIIELRSRFIPNAGSEYIIDLISRMRKDDSVQSDDNGVTQTVTARQGVSLKESVTVKPRVALRPFRTFREVHQPESEFLLRVNDDGGIGLFEADGGIWKIEAKLNIRDYIEAELKEFIGSGDIVVMI